MKHPAKHSKSDMVCACVHVWLYARACVMGRDKGLITPHPLSPTPCQRWLKWRLLIKMQSQWMLLITSGGIKEKKRCLTRHGWGGGKKKTVSRLYLNEASRQRVAAASSRVILGAQDNFTNKNDIQKKSATLAVEWWRSVAMSTSSRINPRGSSTGNPLSEE